MLRNFLQKARFRVGDGLTPCRAHDRAREVEPLPRTSDAHVRQTSFLGQFVGVAERPHVRELAVLPTRHEDDRKFQTLRGVQRHQGDDAGTRIGDLIGVGHQGDPFEERRERPRLGQPVDATVLVAVLVVPGFESFCRHCGLVARLGGEFPRNADEFVEVVQACTVLRIAAGFELGAVAGAVENGLDDIADVCDVVAVPVGRGEHCA